MIDLIDNVLEMGKAAIERIWPDPLKRAEEVRKLEELHQKGDIARLQAEVALLTKQMEINMKEAEHPSLFVSGWRPFVGWGSGFAFLYIAIIEPFMRFIAAMNGYSGEFPVIDSTITLQVLLGMLGLGLMRSYEKKSGVDTKKQK